MSDKLELTEYEKATGNPENCNPKWVQYDLDKAIEKLQSALNKGPTRMDIARAKMHGYDDPILFLEESVKDLENWKELCEKHYKP